MNKCVRRLSSKCIMTWRARAFYFYAKLFQATEIEKPPSTLSCARVPYTRFYFVICETEGREPKN